MPTHSRTMLDLFLRDMGECPRLKHAEQVALHELAVAGDGVARETLILSVLPWAVRMAWRYRSGEPVEELVSWAMPALCQAIDRWDPARGRLTTLVTVCVWQEISMAIRKTHYAVIPPAASCMPKTPRARRAAECAQVMAESLDGDTGRFCSRDGDPVAEAIVAEGYGAWLVACEALPERLRDVLAAIERGETYAVIGKRLGVTRQRVGQLRAQAMKRLLPSMEKYLRGDSVMAHPIGWLNQAGFKGETINPIRAKYGERRGWHCERVSAGCANCYAERQNVAHFRGGTGLPYARQSRDAVEIYLDEKTLEKPLHWKKPRVIFWCSMTDLFGEWVPFEWVLQRFGWALATPWHRHIVLTKRPGRAREFFRWWHSETSRQHLLFGEYALALDAIEDLPTDLARANKFYLSHYDQSGRGKLDYPVPWPLPNLWLLVSVENQKAAKERIPPLLDTPVAVRGVSCEPLLEPVDLSPWIDGLDWVIAGAETGPNARPVSLDAFRLLRDHAQAAGVPFFLKQIDAKNERELDGRTWEEIPCK